MPACPKCNSNTPEGLTFCTQCGAHLSGEGLASTKKVNVGPPKPAAVEPETPRPVPSSSEPIRSRGKAGPAFPASSNKGPSAPAKAGSPGPKRRSPATTVSEEDTPRRVSSAVGGAICRFCKGSLDLKGDFCDQCGAPVEEAAPPGMVKPKPEPKQTPRPEATVIPSPSGAQSEVSGGILSSRGRSSVGLDAPAWTLPPAPSFAPAAKVPAAPSLSVEDIEPIHKLSPKIPLAIGLTLIVAGVVGIAWYLYRSRTRARAEEPVPPVAISTPSPPPSAPEVNLPVPKNAPVARSAPRPLAKPPAEESQSADIVNLQELAREAYAKGNYAVPVNASVIAYAKRVLAIDPADNYSMALLENGVEGGRYQAQQALARKDFATAHRVADALAQLLPGRKDIAGLKEDIAAAEGTPEAARRPQQSAPTLSFRVYHMHARKAPADHGPYCLGLMSVTASRLKFTAESASDGKLHNLEFACSDVREIKKNARVASRQGGFHVHTDSAHFNFVPEDPSAAILPALSSACPK